MSGDAKLRAFVAIDIAPNLRAALGRARDMLSDLPWASDMRWVAQRNLHLTLRFLGDVERSFCLPLLHELEHHLAGVPAFEVTLKGLVAFPSARRPRVIAASVDAVDALTRLAAAVEAAVVAAGGEGEERRFRPHITLGRFRNPPRSRIDLDARAIEADSMTAREVILFRSELGPKGANYSTLGGVALAPSARPSQ